MKEGTISDSNYSDFVKWFNSFKHVVRYCNFTEYMVDDNYSIHVTMDHCPAQVDDFTILELK